MATEGKRLLVIGKGYKFGGKRRVAGDEIVVKARDARVLVALRRAVEAPPVPRETPPPTAAALKAPARALRAAVAPPPSAVAAAPVAAPSVASAATPSPAADAAAAPAQPAAVYKRRDLTAENPTAEKR